jgi:hypothetical protein
MIAETYCSSSSGHTIFVFSIGNGWVEDEMAAVCYRVEVPGLLQVICIDAESLQVQSPKVGSEVYDVHGRAHAVDWH